MKIPLVDLEAQYRNIKPEIDIAIQTILDQTNFISGKEIEQFEQLFSKFIRAKGTVGVASGTAAIHLALLACGIGPGDEVITTAHTFAATAEAIIHSGARPVFVDIDPRTYLIDPNIIEDSITLKTKAILPVHLYGLPAEMNSIMDISKRHNLYVIEDAAQAHGAKYHEKPCGSIGHLACFSFYPGKNLGAYGDAGAVSGNDERLLAKIRKLRDHGRSAKYIHEVIGYGERLDTLQAAVLEVKLRYLEVWNAQRRNHAEKYSQLLSNLQIETPYVPEGLFHVYHQYVIKTSKRDALLNSLKSQGIGAGIHYPVPLNKQPAFINFGLGEYNLPVTESVAKNILSLPMFPELNDDQIEYVVEIISDFFSHQKE
jgi:dTDP-4-amino-4,6-dideoxygalactose transaminase